MADGVDEADQPLFVGGKGTVTRRDGPAEVGDRVLLLDEHRPKAVGRGIAFDDEWLGEVWQRQDWGRRDHGLKHLEGRIVVVPAKPLFL